MIQQHHGGFEAGFTSGFNRAGLQGQALLHDAGGEQDSVSSYFECITACSLDDGECVTRCVEVLREQH
ncbi:MAG: hypothetical protein RLZZ219_58 [Cyanobacteriota bacterium]